MDRRTRDRAAEPHLRPMETGPGSGLNHAASGLVHLAAVGACIAAWEGGLVALVAVLCLAVAWLDHAALTRLHEAAHGMLARSRLFNEIQGAIIGTAALTPLSVYRHVHSLHHAHLGGERDPEFWPYNLPGTPRWVRRTYAWSELLFGWLLTPALYSLRTARSWRSIPPSRRRRLALEWAILGAFWISLLGVVAWRGWWEPLLAGHIVPAWLAGVLQTGRKFTEHLGMSGPTILSMTRTVVYRGRLGRAASRSQLHVDHHGTHHRWARIPYHRLPEATPIAYGDEDSGPVFPSHVAAIRDMVPHLLDPKVGPQWRAAGETGARR